MGKHPLGKSHTHKRRDDAQQDIDDVMVAGVDSRKPDADADKGEERDKPTAAATQDSIDSGYQHVGGMQRRHRGKDIGILAIQGMEDGQPGEGIKARETRVCRTGVNP